MIMKMNITSLKITFTFLAYRLEVSKIHLDEDNSLISNFSTEARIHILGLYIG